jgi:hypothetical protein
MRLVFQKYQCGSQFLARKFLSQMSNEFTQMAWLSIFNLFLIPLSLSRIKNEHICRVSRRNHYFDIIINYAKSDQRSC